MGGYRDPPPGDRFLDDARPPPTDPLVDASRRRSACPIAALGLSDRLARPGNVNVKEGDRLPGGDPPASLRSDGPEIRPGVGARPDNVKEPRNLELRTRNCELVSK
eukprot:1175473-Prorocentrum_minimum.AAC.3